MRDALLPLVPAGVSPETFFERLDSVAGCSQDPLLQYRPAWSSWSASHRRQILHAFAHPDLRPEQAVRLLMLLGLVFVQAPPFGDHALAWNAWEFLAHYRAAHPGALDLAAIARVLDEVGADPDRLGRGLLADPWNDLTERWDAESLWPYFAGRPHLFETDPPPLRSFAYLALAPEPPPPLVERVMQVALADRRTDSPAARRALQRLPDLRPRVREALRSKRKEARTSAAEWLASLGDAEALPDLRAALAREKTETVQAALMLALERLGASLDDVLDRQALAERTAVVSEALAWFPWDDLPPVRWSDGVPVPPQVVRWLLLRSHRLKAPEGDALLRAYAARFEPEDRRRLSAFVLDAWIRQDTIPLYTPAEVQREAENSVASLLRLVGTGDRARMLRDAAKFHELQCRESATEHKGLLGVASVGADEEAVTRVEAFLDRYYGYRAPQCRALLAMLSHAETPRAAWLLLRVAASFRTRGVQKEADRLVREYAERRGWTLEDLADRTVPTAGLEPDGRLVLEDGEARLGDDLDLHPTQGNPDLKAARKEVKAIVRRQVPRLFEAMAAERTWTAEEWEDLFRRHPILGRLAPRLVWLADGSLGFRPLEDGSLVGADDEEVVLPPDARVQLAHSRLVPPAEAERWRRHLADYKVTPLLEAWNRPTRTLQPGEESHTSLTDFQGVALTPRQLLGRSAKLGWKRDPTVDGPWVATLRRSLPLAGLDAVLSTSGFELGGSQEPVELESLTFERAGGGGAVPLGSVPRILLSECWADVRDIASERS